MPDQRTQTTTIEMMINFLNRQIMYKPDHPDWTIVSDMLEYLQSVSVSKQKYDAGYWYEKFFELQQRIMNPPLCVDRETLRDKFAMAALTGILSAEPDNEIYDLNVVTLRAYQVADKMLEARGKK